MDPNETRLTQLFGRYEPPLANEGLGLRQRLRARLPGFAEIVYLYERQQALVISYSPTTHGYDGVCSLALHPDRLLLHFPQAAALSHADPAKLLQGRGKGARHLILGAAADFDRPQVEALLKAALERVVGPPDPAVVGPLIFQVDAQQQRARRAARSTPAE